MAPSTTFGGTSVNPLFNSQTANLTDSTISASSSDAEHIVVDVECDDVNHQFALRVDAVRSMGMEEFQKEIGARLPSPAMRVELLMFDADFDEFFLNDITVLHAALDELPTKL